MKFEIFEMTGIATGRRQFRFRLRASNGKIVAQSQGYRTKRNAIATIELMRGAGLKANVDDLTIDRRRHK